MTDSMTELVRRKFKSLRRRFSFDIPYLLQVHQVMQINWQEICTNLFFLSLMQQKENR